MKLTRSENREALREYEYLKSVSFWKVAKGETQCSEKIPGKEIFLCTLAANHPFPHAAHTPFGQLCAVWDTAEGIEEREKSARETFELAAEMLQELDKLGPDMQELTKIMLEARAEIAEVGVAFRTAGRGYALVIKHSDIRLFHSPSHPESVDISEILQDPAVVEICSKQL